jgi:hypothetical protein
MAVEKDHRGIRVTQVLAFAGTEITTPNVERDAPLLVAVRKAGELALGAAETRWNQ